MATLEVTFSPRRFFVPFFALIRYFNALIALKTLRRCSIPAIEAGICVVLMSCVFLTLRSYRFDPNFLIKRQASLQEYLDGLLQVPGILDDASLQHFFELEKHLDLHSDLGMGSNGRSSGMWSGKGVLSENDRLSGIVESAAQAFIDISEVPEPLEAEQAVQRKNEIVTASQSLLNEQKVGEQFTTQLTTLRLPRVQAQVSNEELLSRLDGENEEGLTYEQEQEFLWGILENLETSLGLEIKPPSVDLLAVMTVSTTQEAPVAGSNGVLPNGNGALEAGSLDERSSLSNGSVS